MRFKCIDYQEKSEICNCRARGRCKMSELELVRRTVISFQCPRQPLMGKHIHEVRHVKAGDDE